MHKSMHVQYIRNKTWLNVLLYLLYIAYLVTASINHKPCFGQYTKLYSMKQSSLKLELYITFGDYMLN